MPTRRNTTKRSSTLSPESLEVRQYLSATAIGTSASEPDLQTEVDPGVCEAAAEEVMTSGEIVNQIIDLDAVAMSINVDAGVIWDLLDGTQFVFSGPDSGTLICPDGTHVDYVELDFVQGRLHGSGVLQTLELRESDVVYTGRGENIGQYHQQLTDNGRYWDLWIGGRKVAPTSHDSGSLVEPTAHCDLSVDPMLHAQHEPFTADDEECITSATVAKKLIQSEDERRIGDFRESLMSKTETGTVGGNFVCNSETSGMITYLDGTRTRFVDIDFTDDNHGSFTENDPAQALAAYRDRGRWEWEGAIGGLHEKVGSGFKEVFFGGRAISSIGETIENSFGQNTVSIDASQYMNSSLGSESIDEYFARMATGGL